jgi:serine/threonine-protein kinase
MAPEQAGGDPAIDHRADIYALGVMAYEMLTGAPPFTGETPQSVLAAHMTRQPEPIDSRRAAVPAPLAAIVMQCRLLCNRKWWPSPPARATSGRR